MYFSVILTSCPAVEFSGRQYSFGGGLLAIWRANVTSTDTPSSTPSTYAVHSIECCDSVLVCSSFSTTEHHSRKTFPEVIGNSGFASCADVNKEHSIKAKSV